jgi:hypothetical protein
VTFGPSFPEIPVGEYAPEAPKTSGHDRSVGGGDGPPLSPASPARLRVAEPPYWSLFVILCGGLISAVSEATLLWIWLASGTTSTHAVTVYTDHYGEYWPEVILILASLMLTTGMMVIIVRWATRGSGPLRVAVRERMPWTPVRDPTYDSGGADSRRLDAGT